MTVMRMFVAGEIKRAELKNAGAKPLLEISLCRKHKGREGAEDTFSWVRATIWEPPQFMMDKAVKGAFFAGSGDYQLRSYDDKEGVKKYSAELRCSSFDCEISGGSGDKPMQEASPAHAVTRRTEPKVNVAMSSKRPSAPCDDGGEVPF